MSYAPSAIGRYFFRLIRAGFVMTQTFRVLFRIARFGLILGSFLVALPSSAREVLRVLAWEGYADPVVVAAFEKRFDVRVEVTYATSDDDLWRKLQHKGRDFDVFAVNTAELQRYIDEGVSIPLDLRNIPNRAGQLPRFRDYRAVGGIVRKEQTHAVPYAYAEMGLIYNRRLVKTAPDSVSVLWAPEYRGRVLMFNTSNHNFSLAAQRLGLKSPFRIDPGDMKRAARELVKLRRNLLGFYSTVEESVELFRKHDVALMFANYGSQQVKALRDAGAEIGYVIPREGAMAWLDCWALSQGVRNRELAERWINYLLEKPVSERLTTEHGLANTVTPFPDSRPSDRMLWLEPLENPDRRKELWDRIVSGAPVEAF